MKKLLMILEKLHKFADIVSVTIITLPIITNEIIISEFIIGRYGFAVGVFFKGGGKIRNHYD